MLKVRWFFVLLVMASVLFLSQSGWAENPDQDWQIIQQRLSERVPAVEHVSPVIKGGLKDGGDLLWWFQGIENVECVSQFVDVDGDGLPDVLVETYDAGAPVADHFYCIKGNSPGYGTVLWSCRPPGGPSNSGGWGDQCVSYTEDLNGDGHPDALLGTAWGGRTAYAIEGDSGYVIWSYDTYDNPPSGWIYSICPIADLTGDGIPEVLFCAGSDADAAYCVNGTNGNLIWKFSANDAVFAVAEIEDVNDDGKNDALIGAGDNEDRIICVSGASSGMASVIWEHGFGASVHDVAAIEDVNGDGKQDALAGVWDGTVYCRSGINGAHIWSYLVGTYDYIMRVVPIDDVDDDGIQDVLVASWGNSIVCLSGVDGSLLCSYPTGGDVWAVDGVDDVNGDGYPEALGGSFDYKVYCVDLRVCDTLWTYYTGAKVFTVRGLPDVDGNTTPDVLAGTQMLSGVGGRVYCIQGGIQLDTVPNIVSTSPAQNELNVAISANISVTFDIDMDETTINDSTFVVNAWSTGLHEGTITYSNLTKTATLDPDSDFVVGEIVTVVLTTDIQSSQGVPMESSYVWSFTTEVSDESPGTFAPAVNYGAGDSPHFVFCADLDGDSALDLAVASYDSDTVFILKNNGNGTFQTMVGYGAGNGPVSVFCADLDGDLDLDLAVANYLSDNASIIKNNGDGTFQTKVDYGAGDGPWSVFCADLDGDGDLDLAVANYWSDDVSILKNNGDGTFQTKVDYGAGDRPWSVFCADLDGDGDLDLAVANFNSDSVSILKNNGDGTFQPKVGYAAGDSPRHLFCADLDGDPDLDLAVPNFHDHNVSILKNNGDGTFQTKVDYGAGSYPQSVFCADLDGDLDLDLAVANWNENISILKNNGDGTFQTKVYYDAGDGSRSVFCADLDGDSDLDLAVANHLSDSVSVLLNCLPTGDCNGDGKVDIADVVQLINYLFIDGPAPEPLEVGDVNCDGVVDIADVVYLINYLFISGPPPGCC